MVEAQHGQHGATPQGSGAAPEYRLICPEIVAQQESFKGIVVKVTPSGTQALSPSETVSLNGQVLTHTLGQVSIPEMPTVTGNCFISLVVTGPATGGRTVAQRVTPAHVEVIPPPTEWRNLPTDPKIAFASDVATPGGKFSVFGDNLTNVQSPGLVAASGDRRNLGQPIALSRYQAIYTVPQDLPSGQLSFTAKDPSGKELSAPQPCYNPPITMTGPTIARQGQQGNFTLSIAPETMPAAAASKPFTVLVTGGGSQIRLQKNTATVSVQNKGSIPFVAEQLGNFSLSARCVNPEDVPLAANAPGIETKIGNPTAKFNEGTGKTDVEVPISAAEVGGKPISEAPVRGAIVYAGGVQHVRTTLARNGRGSFTTSLPGKFLAETLRTHTTSVPGYPWKPAGCILEYRPLTGPGITAKVLSPPPPPESKEPPVVPLVVTGDDADEMLQTCVCLDDGSTASRTFPIADSVIYSWTILSGRGSLRTATGQATIYDPPEMGIGETDEAVLLLQITDMRGNDAPAKVTFTVTTKREGECLYRVGVTNKVETTPGSIVTVTGSGKCVPLPEKWSAVPPITAAAPAEITVGVGQRVVLLATGKDDDAVTMPCGGACGTDVKTTTSQDETVYTWSAKLGGFPDHGGTATTNSRTTTAIYKAPVTAGEDTVDIFVKDSGKQAVDGYTILQIKVHVIEVDLDLEGVPDEEEFCEGGQVYLNSDDDNKSSRADLGETKVPGEDDLLGMTITKKPATGYVVLRAQAGGERIKVWKSKEKEEEVKLPATFPASKIPPLWVEGVEKSEDSKDVTLVAEALDVSLWASTALEALGFALEDPPVQDKAKVTVNEADLDVDTNRNGKVENEEDEKDEDKTDIEYKAAPGALVIANVDDDDKPAKHEKDCKDNKITAAKDAEDFVKLVVRQTKLTQERTAYLQVKGDALGHIRIYQKLAVGSTSVIGVADEDQTEGIDFEFQVPSEELEKGDVEFFIEGIVPGKECEIKLIIFEGEKEAKSDTVRVLVTPIIFHPNTLATERVFYGKWKEGIKAKPNPEFLKSFVAKAQAAVGAAKCVEIDGRMLYTQDGWEVGYQKLPANHEGKAILMPTVVDLPWTASVGGANSYPKEHMLKADFGFYKLGPDNGGGQDYGGNLETIPPIPDFSFGRVVVGANMSEELKKFLGEQGVQSKNDKLIELSFDGVPIAHVDEVICVVPTGSGFKIAIGDLDVAIKMLDLTIKRCLKPLQDKVKANEKALAALDKEMTTLLNQITAKEGDISKIEGDIAKETDKKKKATAGKLLKTAKEELAALKKKLEPLEKQKEAMVATSDAAERLANLHTAYLDPKNKDAQDLIAKVKKSLVDIRATIKGETGLKDGDFISIPVLYPTEMGTDTTPPSWPLAAAINMQVLNGALFIPDNVLPVNPAFGTPDKALFKEFRDEIVKNLTAGGAKGAIHWIHCWELFPWGGSCHCNTNAERKPPP